MSHCPPYSPRIRDFVPQFTSEDNLKICWNCCELKDNCLDEELELLVFFFFFGNEFKPGSRLVIVG